MRKISLSLALVASLFSLPAHADFTGKDASAATITFKNPGTCTSVVCVPVFQIYDGTNVVTLSTAGADGVSNTLTGVPVYSRNVLYNGTTWDRWLGDTTNGGWVNVKTSVLPTGASTSALQTTGNTALTTINNTLGTPFQAGGSIGNTTFAVTQATSSNLKAQVDPLTAASWGIGTATQNSASATNGQLALGQFNTTPTTITTGNMSPMQLDNAGNLLVNIKAGSSAGTVAQGSTTSGQSGMLTQCAVTTAAPSYTTAQTDPFSCDTSGNLRVNVTNTNANGSAVSASSSPVVIASDQAPVAVKAASGAIASGAVASGAVASGAIAAGAVSAGAFVSGSVLSGAYASGALVDVTNFTGSTGSAPPSKAAYLGANASGATGGQVRGLINCDNHVFKHITSATDTLAVQGVASQTIYVCGWRSRAAGVATWFLENTASTNANCSSSNTQITGVATEAANTGEVNNNPIWGGLKNTSGNGLCINSTGTGGVDVDIWYTQF